MSKRMVLRTISFIMLLMAALSFAGILTVKGGGFLDLSNIARIVLCGIAIVCVAVAAFTFKTDDPRMKKAKIAFVIASVIIFVAAAILADSFSVPATEIVN